MRKETETLHKIIDQLERSGGDEEERRRKRSEERPRKDKLTDIKIKVPLYQGRIDPETYIEWETKIKQFFTCNTFIDVQSAQMVALEFT